MIIAGEASGDLHGSGLVRALKAAKPWLNIFGIGGNKMRAQGMELLYHINDMSVLGFWDVIKQFRFFKRVINHLVRTMEKQKPAVLVLIDYPGLNLRLAKAAHQRGIPVMYYIAPQIWAWGAGRIKKIARTVDKMAVIIPFEEKMYRDAGVDANFIGHPLLEVIQPRLSRAEFFQKFGLDPNAKTIGLLPGSRVNEIKRLLPEMVATIFAIKKKHPELQVIIGKAGTVDLEIYRQFSPLTEDFRLIEDHTYDVMKHSDLLLVASGTATLESALLETPLIIVYRVDRFSYFLGRQLVKIDAIGLVNVIAERKIVPEFIQGDFEAEKLVPEMEKLLFDKTVRKQTIINLQQIRQKLGQPGASERAATMALELIQSRNSILARNTEKNNEN